MQFIVYHGRCRKWVVIAFELCCISLDSPSNGRHFRIATAPPLLNPESGLQHTTDDNGCSAPISQYG